MLPDIKKILYATDLSESARYAFNYAAVIAGKFDAKITVIHVIEEISTTGLNLITDFLGKDQWAKIKKEREEECRKKVYKRLELFCNEMNDKFDSCSFIVENIILKEGNPAAFILEEAEKDYDVVIIGTHGHGILAGVLMGNTARRVVRRCEKPVMVVRLPEAG